MRRSATAVVVSAMTRRVMPTTIVVTAATTSAPCDCILRERCHGHDQSNEQRKSTHRLSSDFLAGLLYWHLRHVDYVALSADEQSDRIGLLMHDGGLVGGERWGIRGTVHLAYQIRDAFLFWKRGFPQRLLLSHTCMRRALWSRSSWSQRSDRFWKANSPTRRYPRGIELLQMPHPRIAQ